MDEKKVDTPTPEEPKKEGMDYSFDFSNQVSDSNPAPVEAPAEPAPVEVPVEPAPVETPVETPVEVPVEAPVETPVSVEAPVEAATEQTEAPEEESLKTGRSTIIFGIVLAALVGAFIVLLPFLKSLG